MGVMLLIAVLFLSVVYAALYSVIYMYGTGSVDVRCDNLYYEVKYDDNGQSDGGKFYTKFTAGENKGTSGDTGITTMSAAVKALSGGGNIYILSAYESKIDDEIVTINSKTLTIKRFTLEDSTGKKGFNSGPLFDISSDFTIQLSGENPCLAIDGDELESSYGAFRVSNGATLTLKSYAGDTAINKFVISKHYSTMPGGAINVLGGSVNADSIQFANNCSVSSSEMYGGAIFAGCNYDGTNTVESHLELNKCLFQENTVKNTTRGNLYDGSVYIKGESPVHGGAVCSAGSRVNMSSCKFTRNAADVENNNTIKAEGGAVYIDSTSSGTMNNCTVTGNQSSYSERAGAGVYVAAGDNKFAFSGETVIENNTCYYFDESTESGLNVNDNLCIAGKNENISIDTSGISGNSSIFINTIPEPSRNENLKALISDADHKTSSTEYFKSDVGGYKPAIEDDGNFYLVFSSQYDDLWYGEKTVKGFNELGDIIDNGGTYKGFFTDESLKNDTGFTRLADAVGAVNTNGKIHMLTTYESSVSETVNVPENKVVNVIRESTFKSDSMFKITGGTFTVNATNSTSLINFDGNKDNASPTTGYYGGAFYVSGKLANLVLQGAENSNNIVLQNNKVTKDGGAIFCSETEKGVTLKNCLLQGNDASGSDGHGGVMYIESGENTIFNCAMNSNTARYGGAAALKGGTNKISQCTITGNSAIMNGGAIDSYTGSTTISDSTISGNKASSFAGGMTVCNLNNSLKLTGKVIINDNTVNGSQNNMFICKMLSSTVIVDIDGLTTESDIHLTTEILPTDNNPIKFAINAAEEIRKYFKSDNSDYIIKYNTSEKALYLSVKIYDDLWYKADDTGAKQFYDGTSKSNLTETGITTFVDAVANLSANGTIHMMTSYEKSEGETIEIPAGKNITVVRDDSFTTDSMFKITGGTFEVDATDTASLITFDGNKANVSPTEKYNGGAFYVNGGNIKLNGAEKTDGTKTIIIENNKLSSSNGGGVYIESSETSKLSNCSITNNNGTRGCGVYTNSSGTSILENCSITGNSGSFGGGVCINGDGTNELSNCNIANNHISGHGGAVYIFGGTNTLSNCSMTNNNGSIYGGGVYINDGTSTFTSCNIANNTFDDRGGGIYAYKGTATLEDCDITDNKVSPNSSFSSKSHMGGGIYASEGRPSITLKNSRIKNNTTGGYGGGLCFMQGYHTVENCTIANNTSSDSIGGGVYVANDGNLENCTITGNTATSGGGIYMGYGTNTLKNCTITNNTASSESASGGGLYIDCYEKVDSRGTATLIGTMIITGNTAVVGSESSDNNMYCASEKLVFLSSGSDNKLSADSKIGVTTESDPTLDSPVQFAVKASENYMMNCFTSDRGYSVYKEDTNLYVSIAQDDIYQSDNKFYLDAKKTQLINIQTMADAVKLAKKIHMLSAYTASSDEKVEVPSGKEVTVIREESFTNDSMIKITGGNFTINAPDANSSITFDGNNVEITEIINGGAFNVTGDTTQFTLNGAEGSKNIIVTNNIISKYSTDLDSFQNDEEDHMLAKTVKYLGNNGGGIANMGSGKVSLSNCLISKNSSVMSGAGIASFGDLTMSNCDVTENYLKDIKYIYSGYGGGVACLTGTSVIENCTITSNSATNTGGGITSLYDKSTISNCKISNNSCSGVVQLGETEMAIGSGGGIHCGDGVDTIENCEITNNKAYTGGGISIADFVIVWGKPVESNVATVSNCTITGNKSESDGGGVNSRNHISVFKDCTITGNTMDSGVGGGMNLVLGKVTLLGKMEIQNNTNNNDNSASNLYFNDDASDNNINGISILSDDSGNKLSVDSRIGVATNRTSFIKFAEKGDETMDNCFTTDNESYRVVRIDSDFYLQPMYDDLYYSTKSGSGKFYSDAACSNDTSMTKLSEAVNYVNSEGKIHMMSQYASSTGETVDVPEGKNITVIRDTSFTNASMFSITGGNFTINAPDANSSITFDGDNVEITEIINGGAFNVTGDTTQFTLNGAEGSKNIIVTKNVLTKVNENGSDIDSVGGCGGGICIQSGTQKHTINNCDFNNNKGVYFGGGIMDYNDKNTLEVTNCSFTRNVTSGIGSADGGGLCVVCLTAGGTHIISNCEFVNNESEFAGGGMVLGNGTNTVSNCSLTGNKAEFGAGIECGGDYINTISNCKITGNIASRSGGGIEFEGASETVNILENCTITDNTATNYSGGGIYNSNGTMKLFGTMIVKDNISNGSEGDCYFTKDMVATLSDDSGNKLGSDSIIGVTTAEAPLVKFAEKGDETMDSCFKSNNESYSVMRVGSDFYLQPKYDNLYYSTKSGSGKFYSDASCSNDTFLTKLSQAVNYMNSSGKIYMMSQYVSSASETVDVPEGKNITVIRDTSFKNASMFSITGGDFTVNAPDASSSITFDGQKIGTSVQNGGVFYVKGGSIKLNGAENSSGGKTIAVQNSYAKLGGSGIYIADGTNAISNCSITNNSAEGGSGTGGAGICAAGGSSTLEKCIVSSNTVTYDGGGIFLSGADTSVSLDGCTLESNKAGWGGGIRNIEGTLNVTGCKILSNQAISGEGSGICIGTSSAKTINTIKNTEITNNQGTGNGAGIYFAGNTDASLSLLGTVKVESNKNSGSDSDLYIVGNKVVKLDDGAGNTLSYGSKIGVATEASPTLDANVKFATGATEAMKAYFTPNEANREVFYGNDGNLYLKLVYDTIYQNGHAFYTDEACSNAISGVTTLSRAVEIAKTIVFVGSYELSNSETVTVPAGRTVTLLRSTNFTDFSMFGVAGVTLTFDAPSADSKLIIDGNNVNSTRAKGSMIYINENSNNKLVLKGYSESNQNIEVKNFHTTLGDGFGGAICNIGGGTIDIQNCKFTGNYAHYGRGGAIWSAGGSSESIIKGCEFSDNHALNSYAGGALSLEGGIHVVSNCNFHGNASESASAGGIFVYGGTNRIESCKFKNNSAQWGGAVAIEAGTNVMKDCTITGNTASTFGGGIYIRNGTNALTGVMTITDNICPKGKNLYLYASRVFSLKDGSTSLSEGSNIGITTEVAPAENAPVQFAESATESMKALFTADKANSEVIYQNGKLYLGYTFSTCFYKDGTFYTDEDCTNSTGISKLSDLISKIQVQNSRIYMMSCYNSSGDETTYVPSNKNITVLRHGSFTNNSMFSVTGGTFTVNATDPTSSITFDGNGVGVSINTGGAFKVNGGSINLSGAEKSGGGKTITIQDNVISSSGGGIYIRSGTNTLTNCSLTGNTASSSSSVFGGGVCIDDGTNTLTNCSITGNTASSSSSSSSSAFARGGGVYIGSGTNTLTNCSITGNTVSASLSVSATAYGGGVYLNTGTNTLLGTMNITGNTAKVGSISSDNNLYLQSNYTVALSDSDGNTLSTSSKIGVSTSSAPTSSRSVQFATGATSAMASCFTPDNSSYKVTYRNSDAALSLAVK